MTRQEHKEETRENDNILSNHPSPSSPPSSLRKSPLDMKIRKRGEGFKEDEKIVTAKMKQSQ